MMSDTATTNNMELTENESREKKPIWKKILILILIIILLLLCIRACSGGTADPGGLELGVIDQGELSTEEDRERLQAALNQQVEAGMVSVFMNTDISVTTDGEADWLIQNVEQNHYSLQIDVKDEETGTLIYSSPIVPPGYKVESDAVIETLSAGIHPCLAEFSVIDPETSAQINRIGLKINVTF